MIGASIYQPDADDTDCTDCQVRAFVGLARPHRLQSLRQIIPLESSQQVGLISSPEIVVQIQAKASLQAVWKIFKRNQGLMHLKPGGVLRRVSSFPCSSPTMKRVKSIKTKQTFPVRHNIETAGCCTHDPAYLSFGRDSDGIMNVLEES